VDVELIFPSVKLPCCFLRTIQVENHRRLVEGIRIW
jgi:hypothetical protein